MLRTLRIALITDPLAALCVLMMGLSVAAASVLSPTREPVHKAARFWSRLLLLTSGVRLRVTGREKVPRNRGIVFVANHQSMMDIPTLMLSLPRTIRFLAKESLFGFPLIGWYLRFGQHISVNREDRRDSVRALADARKHLAKGNCVLVFAEGTRSDQGLQEFKAGAAHLAIKAGAPMVPVGVRGTAATLPKGSIHIRPGRLNVCIGEPIETAGLDSKASAGITEELQSRVAALIAETEATAA
jgi:1-acyl-sn-glycerol-3-phosphate acyltransferase